MHADRPQRKRRLQPPAPLPIGARLGAFDVRSVLGQGHYGIVYRVWDPETEAEYAVKEYLPALLAVRDGALSVAPRSPDDAEAFAQGLRFFVNEGKLLSQLRHPSLVHVYGAWEENGTAYMAMDLVAGRNLHDTLRARWKPPREASLRAMLDALLGAVDVLHRAGMQHRDIAPQSVVIGPDGRPLLMDLGAPRRLAAARGETGPAGPRDGFAAVEMYGNGGGHKRGPGTDLYALGATVFFMITGKAPPPAPERQGGAEALPWGRAPSLRYSLDLLAVIAWMMAPNPQDRPQDVAAVRAALAGDGLPERLRPRLGARLLVLVRRHRRWALLLAALMLLAAAAVGAKVLMGMGLLPGFQPPA